MSEVEPKKYTHTSPWDFKKVIANIFEYIGDTPELMAIVMGDVERWGRVINLKTDDPLETFERLFISRQEFRTIVRFRIGTIIGHSDVFSAICAPTPDWFYVPNLYLSAKDVGPGLYIEHGFSSIVFAKSIGKNFWLNQNVTIGSGKGGTPIIGDDVSIRTGAVVFGGIKIGNRVKIGANAVVNFDVPDDAVVVGPRAAVINKAQSEAERDSLKSIIELQANEIVTLTKQRESLLESINNQDRESEKLSDIKSWLEVQLESAAADRKASIADLQAAHASEKDFILSRLEASEAERDSLKNEVQVRESLLQTYRKAGNLDYLKWMFSQKSRC